MIALAALALVAALPVESAERAFDHAAVVHGQWTAFRAFAAPDAIMFAPDKVTAQLFLAGKADPAVTVRWQPAATITSCDGTMAVSVGPWRKGKATGTFLTVWRFAADGWRWVYDDGDAKPARDRLDAHTPAHQQLICAADRRSELRPITSPMTHPPIQINGYPPLAFARNSDDGSLDIRIWSLENGRQISVVSTDRAGERRLIEIVLDR